MNKKTLTDRVNKALNISEDAYITTVLTQCLKYINKENKTSPDAYPDLQIPLTFGKYKGKTLDYLIENDIYYVYWIVKDNVMELSNESRGKIKKAMKTQHNRNKRHFGKRTKCDWSGGADWMPFY